MNFTKRINPTDYDIPLALVESRDYLSGDFIHIVDFSSMIEGNQVSENDTMMLFNTTRGDDKGKLIGAPRQLDIMVTNEYFIDQGTGQAVPLWYIHNLTDFYYNPHIKKKKIILRSASNFQADNLTEEGEVLVNNISLGNVLRIGTDIGGVDAASSEVPMDNIYIDYGRNGIRISPQETELTGAEVSVRIEVEYQVVPVDINVSGNDTDQYRIELFPTDGTGDNGEYRCQILSSTRKYYTVNYLYRNGNDNITIKTEKTDSSLLFSSAPKALVTGTDITDADISILRSFSVSESIGGDIEIYVPTNNDGGNTSNIHENRFPDIFYAVRSSTMRNGAVSIVKPHTETIEGSWSCGIFPGHITNDNGTYHIPFSRGTSLIKRTRIEQATVINKQTIRVYSNSILTSRDSDGNWSGISVRYQVNNASIPVDYVDTTTGIINLGRQINVSDVILVTYQTYYDGIPIEDICLNPMHTHTITDIDTGNPIEYSVSDSVFLYLMIPDSKVEGDKNIFVKVLPRYQYGETINYTWDQLEVLINTEDDGGDSWGISRIEAREDIVGFLDLHTDLLVGTAGDSGTWYDTRMELLALVYVESPTDENGFTITDATIYGGGLIEPQGVCYDYSYYDGEITDLSIFLDIYISNDLRNNLITLAKLWDPETVISENQNQIAELKVDSLIEEKVDKFSIYGTEKEITYSNG